MAEKGEYTAGVDVLHPLARLHSVHCCSWRVVEPVHCVLLHNIVAILHWCYYDGDTVYISSTNDLSSWTSTRLPHYHTSLSTYQDQLVAVGGRHRSTRALTNELLTSSNGRDWQSTLPVMPTARYWTSAVSAKSPAAILVVAGGWGLHNQDLDIVEVLLGNQWSTVFPLPTAHSRMRSTLYAGSIYFTPRPGDGGTMYTCTCESLCAAHDDRTSITVWTKIKVSYYTRTIASYASRLVSIDGDNVIRGYNNGHWTDMTVEGDWKYGGTGYIAAAELPTGGLVVTNESGVFTLTLSVGTFDPDSMFISDVLFRLEAVMGLKIVSTLASIHQQFTTSSGVTLKPRQDRYGKKLPLPDPQTAPSEYLEEVLLQWKHGHSHRPPTWRELLHVLQEVGQLELGQQIETFMKGEVKFVDAYRHFISTKDVLELFFLKFLFVGPPRLGKTTLRRRLMGEIVDLISAGEAEQCHPSTATVESGHSVIVRNLSNTTAVIAQAEWSAAESLTDEARMVFHNFVDSIEASALPKPSSESAPVTPIKTAAASSKSSLPAASARAHFVTAPEPSRLNKFISKLKSLKLGRKRKQCDDTPDYHDIPEVAHDIPEVAAIIKECYHPDFWKEAKHAFKAYLRMEDTGGQPELMDMLPALTVGPGLYLLFFNYELDLKSEFKVFYQSTTGETSLPEHSPVTLEEMLLSTLSSISCSSSTAAKDTNSSDMQHILQSSKSMVYFVGTHKDQVSEDHIASFDEKLQKIIRDTDFFENGLVQFFSENKLVISIDNMGGGAGEVDEVHKLLEVAMEHHFKKLRIPAVWLLFSLCLRTREVRTASLQDCLELSKLFNMSSYETKTALWFLHHHAGVMMYFPDVLGLEDLIIIDIQVVYDSVTHLILRAMQFGKVSLASAEKFRRSGQFVLQDLITATCNISGDLIPPLKLITLLEYLHIIARIDSTIQSVSLAEPENETVYIMPCVLHSASKVTLDSVFGGVSQPHLIAPLMVRYKCGFVPIGIFPAMIASLIANGSFQLVETGMMKNLVQFRYGSLHALVSFVSCPKFYGIIISELPLVECEPHRLCVEIRKEVESTLEKVSSHMNYGYFMDYHFAFECPSHPGRDHLCVFEGDVAEPKLMLCFQDLKNKVPAVMEECHKVWFGVELTSVCENSACNPLHFDETVFDSDERRVRLFKKEIPTLVEIICHFIPSVGSSCYGEDLISDDTYDYLRLPAVRDRDKAGELLMNVKDVISQDPQALMKFLEILKKYSLCEAFVTKIQGIQ